MHAVNEVGCGIWDVGWDNLNKLLAIVYSNMYKGFHNTQVSTFSVLVCFPVGGRSPRGGAQAEGTRGCRESEGQCSCRGGKKIIHAYGSLERFNT